MASKSKEYLICDCEGTMPLNGKALAKGLGREVTVHRRLCRDQIDRWRRATEGGAPLVVACTQEAPLFLETIADLDEQPEVAFANIREKGGWSRQGQQAMPKIAALLAEAALDIPPPTAVTMTSEGRVLVIGKDDGAVEAAKQLAGRLDVTLLLLAGARAAAPRLMSVPVFTGRVTGAAGHLGAFRVSIAGMAPVRPSSRESLEFAEGGAGGVTECDLILDLGGAAPLFPAPEKRDGYFNPDPGNPALAQRAMFDIVDMVGTFEKPRYVDYNADICVHGRSGISGCQRCLDACPAGAITSDGDGVTIDPHVCGGCGACAGVCPTGAAGYAVPDGNSLLTRLRVLLGAYLDAGGRRPVLLVHDPDFGEDMIDAMARFAGGLPANVLPFAVNQTTQVGLDFLLTAISYGAERVLPLVPPARAGEAAGLMAEAATANAILAGLGYGAGRIAPVNESDPAALGETLYALAPMTQATPGDFLSAGGKRTLLNMALAHLHQHAPNPVEVIDLPEGAPFGAVRVDVAGCTLCLACVGACPVDALRDNPERPELHFAEANCVQCGLCRATCPESVISLVPRLNFAEQARRHMVVKAEEPFACVRCGTPFGARATIERMVERLSGHSMFAGPEALERLKMCNDCRVIAMMEDKDHPMAGQARPLSRTTEDDLREREELRKKAAAASSDDDV